MIRKYFYGDINEILDPKEPGEFNDLDLHEYTHYAETVINDGRVVAVMGIVKMWTGVGQGFVVTSKSYKGGIRYMKASIACLNAGMIQLGLWRLQTYIDERWLESKRFAELIGMEKECRLRKMAPDGRDLFLYARVDE